ncbi:hypothetical protein OAE88_00605 [bacterium]|nr:hypothetical protein [bacterium]
MNRRGFFGVVASAIATVAVSKTVDTNVSEESTELKQRTHDDYAYSTSFEMGKNLNKMIDKQVLEAYRRGGKTNSLYKTRAITSGKSAKFVVRGFN